MEEELKQSIVDFALLCEGQEEIPGNQGFKGSIMQKYMVGTGWQLGQAWCSYFVELVWSKAGEGKFSPEILEALIRDIFHPSAVTTFNNFKKAGWEISDKAEIGSIAVWQRYKNNKAHWTGHTGVVVATDPFKSDYTTMEGNTNDKGGREGYIVAQKENDLLWRGSMKLLGFVVPQIYTSYDGIKFYR